MSRRLAELAKEWGVEPKDLSTRLEKIGLRNKRAQSSLTDEEVQRAATELNLGDRLGRRRLDVYRLGFRLLDERLRHRRQRWRNLVRLDQRLMPGERLEHVALHADGLQRLDEVVVRFRRRGAAPDHLGADAPLDDRRAGLTDDDAFTADRDLRLLDEAELFGGALHLFVAQRALGALVAQPDLLESSREILGLDVPFFRQFVHPARHRHVPHSPASG